MYLSYLCNVWDSPYMNISGISQFHFIVSLKESYTLLLMVISLLYFSILYFTVSN